MRIRLSAMPAAGALLATLWSVPASPQDKQIGPPPAGLALAPFYTKSLDVDGIPISSSALVPDPALRAAAAIVRDMLEHRPDIAQALVRRHQRVALMAESEGTVDLPEQSDWKKPARDDERLTFCERKHYDERIGVKSDRDYWNERARGMGGVLTSAATENLLGFPGTRYFGENIFVHEFSHAIMEAIEEVDKPLYAAIERSYADALRHGRWKGEYGETTVQEYWAEGTQFWFESNKIAVIDHRTILDSGDLARYDVSLARVLRRVYGDRHRLTGDVFWRHAARVPAGGPPASTAEEC